MHKVTILVVVVDVCVCVFKKAENSVCSVCALHLSVGMNLSKQESFRMHMGVGVGERWRLLGFVLEALWWSWVSQALSLNATYPFLGKHPH